MTDPTPDVLARFMAAYGIGEEEARQLYRGPEPQPVTGAVYLSFDDSRETFFRRCAQLRRAPFHSAPTPAPSSAPPPPPTSPPMPMPTPSPTPMPAPPPMPTPTPTPTSQAFPSGSGEPRRGSSRSERTAPALLRSWRIPSREP